MDQFTGKVFITGKIIAKTGLHVGGSKTSLDIGGIPLNVIKTANGLPFIPGSSLKGKLRSILAREKGSTGIGSEKYLPPNAITDRQFPYIIELFGDANDKITDGTPLVVTPARLIVRDAILDELHFRDNRSTLFSEIEDDFYTESKWENTIKRMTGTAINPRQLERVPAGAKFDFEIIYNVYNDNNRDCHLNHLIKAMRILEDDYLGGQGSRGCGKICFADVTITTKTIADYLGDNTRKELEGVNFSSGCL
jgi:CRISPR-associated protein Csm3